MPPTTAASTPATGGGRTAQQQLVAALEREHATTMKVLRAYPPEQAALRPHPKAKSAHELAFVFAGERGLAQKVYNDAFASAGAAGASGLAPKPPDSWSDTLRAIEDAQKGLLDLLRSADDEALSRKVKFFTGPKTMGDYTRLEFLWFLIYDEIHHRGQFSVYLRMAGGKVPSIYGPTGDEPWT